MASGQMGAVLQDASLLPSTQFGLRQRSLLAGSPV